MSSKIEILKKATCISQYIKIDTIKFLMKIVAYINRCKILVNS